VNKFGSALQNRIEAVPDQRFEHRRMRFLPLPTALMNASSLCRASWSGICSGGASWYKPKRKTGLPDLPVSGQLAAANGIDGHPGAVGRILHGEAKFHVQGNPPKPRPSIRRKQTLLSFCQGM